MKIFVVLCAFSLILSASAVENYLILAFDSAMAMKANFDSNANHYRDYLNYETDSMSYNLHERVAQALQTASTSAQGAAIQNCAVMAAYHSTGAVGTLLENISTLQLEALVFYKIILEELYDMNVFKEDFEIFYYKFQLRMNSSYDHLNDVLLQNVLDALNDLMEASRMIFNNLDTCLNAV